MPFNGSGTFVPVSPPNYPAITGTTISSTAFNTWANDIMVNGLTRCLTRDGQGALTGNLNFGGFRVTNSGAAVAAGDLVTKGYVDAADANFISIADPALAGRALKLLSFDAAGDPIPGPLTSDLQSLITNASAQIPASRIDYTLTETGAVAQTLVTVMENYLSVFDFLTTAQRADVKAGTLLLNVTAGVQAAINAAGATGQILHVPAGNYLVNALSFPDQAPGRIVMEMDTKAIFSAATTNMTILNIGPDVTREGPRIVRGGVFHGRSLAGVIGIQTGSAGSDVSNVSLYAVLRDVTVTFCVEAVIARNAQELICDGLISYANEVGFVANSNSVNGNLTVLQFYSCKFQNCRVGFFGRQNSVFPCGGWLFLGCTFQTSILCNMALYGNQGANNYLTNITIDNCHFENGGILSSPGDTYTVQGQIVTRGNVILNGTRMTATGGELGANIVSESFILREGSTISVRDATLGGGGAVRQFDCDATSSVQLGGACFVSGSADNVLDWSGWSWDGESGGGIFGGAPLVLPSTAIPNEYAGTGLTPNTPEVGNGVGVTLSKVLDLHHGRVQRVVFLASIGSTGANRAILEALPMSFALGDFAAISILVNSTVATTITFQAVGGTTFLFSGTAKLRVGWQRLVLYGVATAAEAGGFNVFMFPTDTAGATVEFAKIMVVKNEAAQGTHTIVAMVRNGWYDDMVSPVYGTGIPTSGTWPRGKRIINSAPSVGAARAWTKVTTGATNVLATDWISEGNL